MRYIPAFIIAIVLVSCANSSPAARPGSAAVYEAIEAETDCAELQTTFDRAWENWEQAKVRGDTAEREWTRSYMAAADDRMQQVGCYD